MATIKRNISELPLKDYSFEEKKGFLGPEHINVLNKGLKVCSFYFNMRGYVADFSLADNNKCQYGFSGEMSKAKAIKQFKEAISLGYSNLTVIE